ncbi:hypothetical protein [Janthinobacterium svalbardensis]|uniref:hypothetical protein n=1 Tax=Janthinobacterium svalbardensis TaxID=368607 RepID=UPI002FCDDA51
MNLNKLLVLGSLAILCNVSYAQYQNGSIGGGSDKGLKSEDRQFTGSSSADSASACGQAKSQGQKEVRKLNGVTSSATGGCDCSSTSKKVGDMDYLAKKLANVETEPAEKVVTTHTCTVTMSIRY